MYVIIAPIQIKEGCKDEFVKALLPNAQAAANTEPGCLRFDVIQDAGDPNRLWVYEIYVDEDAFKAHQASEHYLEAIETMGPMRADPVLQGAARGSTNVWPTDAEWK